MKILKVLFFLSIPHALTAQATNYDSLRQVRLSSPSPFELIIARELPATIVYEDEEIIAFHPLRLQAPIHILIVPKQRIPTMNDITEEDIPLVGKMMFVAKSLAKEMGIDSTGYRLTFNTNEDSGQSVFHIHLHLLGGRKLGPMVEQEVEEID